MLSTLRVHFVNIAFIIGAKSSLKFYPSC